MGYGTCTPSSLVRLFVTTWMFVSLATVAFCSQIPECGETITLDADRPTINATLKNRLPRRHDVDSAGKTGESEAGEERRHCFWIIRGPPGSTIRVALHSGSELQSLFVVDGLGNRTADGIEVGPGDNGDFVSNDRGVICRLPESAGEEDQVTIQASMQGVVSPAAAQPGQCGGTIHLDQDSPSVSIEATNSYSSGGSAYCKWYVYSPAGTNVILKFNQVFMDSNNDVLRVYGSQGRSLLDIFEDNSMTNAPHPVIGDGYLRIFFDGYYSVSDSMVSMDVSYTDKLVPNNDNVILLSGGVIELNENVTSLTLQSTNFSSHDSTIYMSTNWYVTGPVGRRIKAVFHSIQPGQYVDFYVYDSATTSRKVSSYSNPSLMPEDRVFSDNAARFNTYWGQDYPGEGVVLTLSITDEVPVVGPQTCGGTVELSDSHPKHAISSPYYFNQQFPTGYIDCWWYVTSPPGKEVQVTWLDIAAPNEYIHLYDYDYPSSTSYHVSHMRGNINEGDISPFVSTHGGVILSLDDNSSGVNGQGFLVNVSLADGTSVVGPKSCGGTVSLSNTMPNFTLNSPYYNQQYSTTNYVNCYWHVLSPTGRQVQLAWIDVETISEYVSVYDDPTSTSDALLSVKGDIDVEISPVVSSRGGLTIHLNDYSTGTNGKGFLFEFTLKNDQIYSSPASCGGTIPLSSTSPNATFSTPYYYQSSMTSVNMNCYWYITSPSGEEVQLILLDMDASSESMYVYDYPSYRSYLISRLSGRLEQDTYTISSRGGLTLHYYDYSSSYNGGGFLFEARIANNRSFSSPESCGGTISLTTSIPSVTFSTPLYFHHSNDQMETECWWYVIPPLGEQVQLTVVAMETANEYLLIYDHTSSTSSSYQVSYLSGRLESNANVLSTRGGLTMRYEDNGYGANGPGFLFEARILESTPQSIDGICGGTVPLSTSTPSVTMTSPGFVNPTANNIYTDCWLYVNSPSGQQVQMTVRRMETESEELNIYDYPTSTSSSYRISSMKGNVSESTAVSTRGGFAFFLDDQYSGRNGPGFILEAALIDDFSWDDDTFGSCGQTVQFDSSSPPFLFTTPTYPMEVSNDQYNCYWYFACPYGYRIVIDFSDFDLYSYSYFYVYDYTYATSTYEIAQISARSLPGSAPIHSSSNRLTVYFEDNDWSDETRQRGISASVAIVQSTKPVWDRANAMSSCGSAITLSQEHDRVPLSTPDYLGVNGDYYECTWFVTSPSQTVIHLLFDDFSLDGSAYFRAYDGQHTGYTQLLYATGSTRPSDVKSTSNHMTIRYYSNREFSGIGASFTVAIFREAKVICDSTSMTVLLDKGLIDDDNHEGDVHFIDESCVGYDHSTLNFALYTQYDKCGTTMEQTDSKIIYSNIVTHSKPEPINGTSITRKNILQIPVRCELDRRQLLGESFVPNIGVVSFSEEGFGNFSLSLDRYPDPTFDKPVIDDKSEVDLGEHLYFAVNLTSISGLTLLIENCLATPTPFPEDSNAYTFLDNGCPKDSTMIMLNHADLTFRSFQIDAFAFIDQNPQVYIHCEVLVCNTDPSSRCAQGCQPRIRRGGRQTRGASSIPHLISNGPLSSHKGETSGVGTLGVTAGLFIGVLAASAVMTVGMVTMYLYMKSSRRSDRRSRYHLVNDVDFEEEEETLN